MVTEIKIFFFYLEIGLIFNNLLIIKELLDKLIGGQLESSIKVRILTVDL